MQTQIIMLDPDDELARQLNREGARLVVIEVDGVRYDVVRRVENIWADYDPQRALAAVEKSAGILKRAGVDAEQLERDIYENRTQKSNGFSA